MLLPFVAPPGWMVFVVAPPAENPVTTGVGPVVTRSGSLSPPPAPSSCVMSSTSPAPRVTSAPQFPSASATTSKSTTPPWRQMTWAPGRAWPWMCCRPPYGGSVIVGGSGAATGASTVTSNEAPDELPEASVALHATVVVPTGKTEPDGGVHDTIGFGSVSSVALTS